MTYDTNPLIETGYGVATGESSFSAGVEATRQALSGVNSHPLSAVLIYASVRFDLEEVLRGVHTLVGDTGGRRMPTPCSLRFSRRS